MTLHSLQFTVYSNTDTVSIPNLQLEGASARVRIITASIPVGMSAILDGNLRCRTGRSTTSRP